MTKLHGTPCWYELSTSAGNLGAAEAFYGDGPGLERPGTPGWRGSPTTSPPRTGTWWPGSWSMPPDAGAMPPFWMIYFAVDDADKAAADVEAAGGAVHRAPADIPGTGRFAVVGDPQGAGFGILQPEPMDGRRAPAAPSTRRRPGTATGTS